MDSLEERLVKFFNQDVTLNKFREKFEGTIRSGLEESGWVQADIDRAVEFLTEKTMEPLVAVKSGVE